MAQFSLKVKTSNKTTVQVCSSIRCLCGRECFGSVWPFSSNVHEPLLHCFPSVSTLLPNPNDHSWILNSVRGESKESIGVCLQSAFFDDTCCRCTGDTKLQGWKFCSTPTGTKLSRLQKWKSFVPSEVLRNHTLNTEIQAPVCPAFYSQEISSLRTEHSQHEDITALLKPDNLKQMAKFKHFVWKNSCCLGNQNKTGKNFAASVLLNREMSDHQQRDIHLDKQPGQLEWTLRIEWTFEYIW